MPTPYLISKPHQPSKAPTTFDEYISLLPAWERNLLDGRQALYTPSGTTLSDFLTSDEDVYLCSDAAVVNHGRGSYLWVIASEKEIIYQGGALVPPHSKKVTRGRSENFGALAVIRFLLHYSKYHGISLKEHHETTRWMFFCDNQGVTSRLKWMQGTVQLYHRTTYERL